MQAKPCPGCGIPVLMHPHHSRCTCGCGQLFCGSCRDMHERLREEGEIMRRRAILRRVVIVAAASALFMFGVVLVVRILVHLVQGR